MSNTPNTEDWQWLEDALDDLQFESITSPSGDSATKLKAIRDAKATITTRIQQLTEAAGKQSYRAGYQAGHQKGVMTQTTRKHRIVSRNICPICKEKQAALHPQDTTRGQE